MREYRPDLIFASLSGYGEEELGVSRDQYEALVEAGVTGDDPP